MRTIIPHTENPALREIAKAVPVADITSPFIKTLIKDMKALLKKEPQGVAIAAPQLGYALQIFVVSGEALEKRSTKYDDEVATDMPIADEVYINPTLLKMSRGKKEKHEGCLSIRGKWGMVPRAEKATITAYDEHGKKFTRGASGFLAHIFQHETDHLNGILYTDKAASISDDKDKDVSDEDQENHE